MKWLALESAFADFFGNGGLLNLWMFLEQKQRD